MSNSKRRYVSIARIIMELVEKEKPQNVQQLISIVRDKTLLPESEIIEYIIKLNAQGKILLGELSQRPQNLGVYLHTKKARWYPRTLILAIAAAITVLAIPENVYPLAYMRHVLGIVFAVCLPGYSFTKALFPKEITFKKPSQSLASIERLGLSLGLSFSLISIVSLFLNYTPWGIRLAPIVISLLALTAMFATLGIIREHRFQLKANMFENRVELHVE